MFKKIYKFILLLLLSSSTLSSMEIKEPFLVKPERLKDVRIFHNDRGFFAEHNNIVSPIQNAFVDQELRNLTDERLGYLLGIIQNVQIEGKVYTFYKIMNVPEETAVRELDNLVRVHVDNSLFNFSNYIKVSELSNGELCLHFKVRLPGGGPLLGNIAYWVVSGTGQTLLTVLDALSGGATVPVTVGARTIVQASALVIGTVAAGTPTP